MSACSFHTIPTVRFKLFYGGKSMSYSSDTHYNPEVILIVLDVLTCLVVR